MLLKMSELEAIKTGRQTLVFRRWRRPTVKTGGTLKTAVGILSLERIAQVERAQITAEDAANAGYHSLEELLSNLDSRAGEIYRIEVLFAGADPRLALRENDQLTPSDFHEIQARLARLDSASRSGAWTRTVLQTIDQNPHVPAGELAVRTGFEKAWLKRNIRKLKNLGLTISHSPGYELSPRGRAFLNLLEEDV